MVMDLSSAILPPLEIIIIINIIIIIIIIIIIVVDMATKRMQK
jgi:hypothetical protein